MKFVIDDHLTGDTSQRVQFTVTGKTIEDLHVAAHKALTALVPDRPFGIYEFRISPFLRSDGGLISLWEASVEASVPPIAPENMQGVGQ